MGYYIYSPGTSLIPLDYSIYAGRNALKDVSTLEKYEVHLILMDAWMAVAILATAAPTYAALGLVRVDCTSKSEAFSPL